MGHTRKKLPHKFDDEQYSGRSGKHTKHTNNRKFNGMPILNTWVDEAQYIDDLSEESVDSDINKESEQ